MRKANSLAVCVLLMMVISGCGSDQDKTVISYCKALDAGNVEEAASYLSKDALQVLDNVGGKQVLAAAGNAFKLHKGIKKVEVVKKKVSGEKADVMVAYSFNDGTKISDSFPLVREAGNWKISK